ncbi:hypothetical protein V8C34DRAFT_225616 [Trichoderma compactum]
MMYSFFICFFFFPVLSLHPRLARIIRDTPGIITKLHPTRLKPAQTYLHGSEKRRPVHETKERNLCPSTSKRQGCALVRNRDSFQPYLKHQRVARKDNPLTRHETAPACRQEKLNINSMYQAFFSSHTF